MRDKFLVLGLSAVIVLGALYLQKKVFVKKKEEPKEVKDSEGDTGGGGVVRIQKEENEN